MMIRIIGDLASAIKQKLQVCVNFLKAPKIILTNILVIHHIIKYVRLLDLNKSTYHCIKLYNNLFKWFILSQI